MSLFFKKLVGAGNDFVFIESTAIPHTVDRANLAKVLCDRHWGVGADGLVIISVVDIDKGHFAWDFYNNDGSSAEMCGNAARCVALYCQKTHGKEECSIDSVIGSLRGGFTNSGEAFIQWELAQSNLSEKILTLPEGRTVKGYFVNTGVPHFVIQTKDQKISGPDCLLIQENEIFRPAQTNVTLLDEDSSGAATTRTFERGVKDFTLACGTGVIASALVLQSLNSKNKQYLQAPGGAMEVELSGSKVKLIGPTQITFNGHYNQERF